MPMTTANRDEIADALGDTVRVLTSIQDDLEKRVEGRVAERCALHLGYEIGVLLDAIPTLRQLARTNGTLEDAEDG